MQAMHLVFLNQYYPPDAAPTGVMLEAVVGKLAADGHRVTVLCAEGGYAGGSCGMAGAGMRGRGGNRRPKDGVPEMKEAQSAIHDAPSELQVWRVGATRFGRAGYAGKLIDYLTYYLGVVWRLLWMRPCPDRVVALTTPPFLSVLARLASRLRGGDHAHWVMDVYPEVMVAHGMLRRNSLRHHLLAALARWGCGGDRCAAVVTLGPDMAALLTQLCPETSRRGIIRWVPLWNGADDVAEDHGQSEALDRSLALRRRRGWNDLEMIVMYSGNMGLGHRFGEILEVIGRDTLTRPPPDLSPSPLRFVFFGGGRRRGEIEEFMAANPGCLVELHDYVPREELAQHLRSADLHLVSLDPLWTGTMLPSKLQGIFAAARPVVFIGDGQSSLARWIHESGGGWVVDPGDVDGLVAAIDEARMRRERMLRGQAAKAFAMTHFDRETNARRVAAWLGCERQGTRRCLDGRESPQDAPAADGSGMHRRSSWISGKDSAGS